MRNAAALGLIGLLLLLAVIPLASAGGSAPQASAAQPPPTGNITGPSVLATSANGTFYLNATGGPAVVSGIFVGKISWNATFSGPNTTGTSVSPSNGTITNATSQPVKLTITTGAIVESLTLTIKLTSLLSSTNSTANISKTFQLVTPYTIRASLLVGPNVGTLPFNVTIAVDGTVVATVLIPALSPNSTYGLVYRYPGVGLSSGSHTVTLSVADEHGLVTFANGATVETTTFYVAPAASNDTVWYVVGVIAFFGVLFIYSTRVAARRRGPARR